MKKVGFLKSKNPKCELEKIKYKSIFLFLVLSIIFCNPPSYESPCNIKSNYFRLSLIFNASSSNKSDFCGLKMQAGTPSGTSTGTPTGTGIANFTLAGTLTGLSSAGLILSSGTTPNQSLTISSGSTTFQFATSIASGSVYSVTVNTQPASDSCTITNGSGTIAANVSNITIACTQAAVAIPVFSPTPGHYSTPQSLTLSTTTPGASIFLSFNGTNPTSASTPYTPGFIWIAAGVSLRAIAIKPGLTDSAIASGVFTYPPLKTGQTSVFTAGDDGTSQTGVARSYTDNGDGTVTDNATSLVWQKCNKGLSGPSCGSGTTATDTHANSISYCSGLNLASKSWRLPATFELETLFDYSASPSINGTFFPGTAVNFYWAANLNPSNLANAMTFNFANANESSQPIASTNRTRCVSGGNKNLVQSFTDNNDGTIKDNTTGLIWQKCSRGQNNDATCSGAATQAIWLTILGECSILNLAGKTWRLPNTNELISIADFEKITGPKINLTFFQGTLSNAYWTSTTFPGGNKGSVDFSSAFIASFNLISTYSMRCVSGP